MNIIYFVSFCVALFIFLKQFWDHIFIYFFAHHYFNNSITSLKTHLKYSKDAWAVVTGATDGIGKAYALILARIGFNLILIGRSKDKLIETKQYILNDTLVQKFRDGHHDWLDYGILDFSIDDAAKIISTINNLMIKNGNRRNLKILVNNAGVSYNEPNLFLEVPDGYKIFQNIVSVNISSVLIITRACLEFMELTNKEKSNFGINLSEPKIIPGKIEGGGIIINISSFSAIIPIPGLSVYAASKAFINQFSASLDAEYKTKGLYIQSVMPYFVATKMTKIKRITLFHPDPLTFVESAIKMVGIQKLTFGYWPHALVGLIAKTVYFIMPTLLCQIVLKGIKKRKK